MYARIHNLVAVFAVMTAVMVVVLFASIAIEYRDKCVSVPSAELAGWQTNTSKTLVNLCELSAGGPVKDGIPAITSPEFEIPFTALKWLPDREPVISVTVGSTSKAYPLQILIWHEIVNDTIEGVPVAVTFCPLSYSAAAYKRTLKGRKLIFGVSGMLRNSGMIMYDRQSETLWQQFSGLALVGDMAGGKLECIPSQIISFGQFTKSNRYGQVLSRKTGFKRPYGENPYVGYDNAAGVPVMFQGDVNGVLSPMERVIGVDIEGLTVAYPCYLTGSKGVINDVVGDIAIAVFHNYGAVSAVDRLSIRNSRQAGSCGVFSRRLEKYRLTFSYDGKYFKDMQTRSTWTVTGKAIEGPLLGKQLTAIQHRNCFAFAWLVFNPQTQIYR